MTTTTEEEEGPIQELTTTQLAVRIGVSERTIQRWLKEHRLRAVKLAYNRYAVESGELQRLRLAEHINEETRIQALERQMRDLTNEVQQLRSELAHLTEQVSRWTTPPTRATRAAPREQGESPPATQLPGGLVGAVAFAKQHGLAETTVRKAIAAGRLPTERGEWKAGRAVIKETLDQAGRQRFYELYHDHDHFTPCAECPHTGYDNDSCI